MSNLSINDIGSKLFSLKSDLEIIVYSLQKIRENGLGPNKMVPLSVIAAESKANSILNLVIELIKLLTDRSKNKP